LRSYRNKHGGHVDYLHDGHLHHPHEGHYDEHVLEVMRPIPTVVPRTSVPDTMQRTRMAPAVVTKRFRMLTMSIIWWTIICITPTRDTAITMAR
jgi:hypothetical protein